jgi:hypothetical protein
MKIAAVLSTAVGGAETAHEGSRSSQKIGIPLSDLA